MGELENLEYLYMVQSISKGPIGKQRINHTRETRLTIHGPWPNQKE